MKTKKKARLRGLLATVMVLAICVGLVPTVALAQAVTTGDALKTAIASGGEITLDGEITLNETLEIASDKSVTLDLAGNTLTIPNTGLKVYGSLTVKDSTENSSGKITSSGNVVEVSGAAASFTLESGTIESTASSGTTGYGIAVFQGGTATVNGGTITTQYAAISGNNLQGDMNVYVKGGTLTAKMGPAIYMPSDGLLNIAGGTINGGVMARMGDITITGGEILNQNSNNVDTFKDYYNYSGNVWYPNALTLYPGSYSGQDDNNLSLTITGGTFKSTVSGGDAVAVYVGGKTNSDIKADISGGTFTAGENGKAYEVVKASDAISGYTDTVVNFAESAISGGTFSTEVATEYCADDYTSTKNSDGTYSVHKHSAVKTEAKDATCTEAGNIEYWYCEGCGKYFSDENCVTEINQEALTVAAAGHKNVTKVEAKAATSTAAGNIAYWHCADCGKYFSDEALTTEIAQEDTIIAATGSATDPTNPTTPTDNNKNNKTNPDTGGTTNTNGITTDAKSPQTGDSSNLALWIALLALAAAGMTGTVIYGKKRRTSANK